MYESDWQVVIDTVHLFDQALGKRYSALEIYPHPDFSEENNDYDLGLLRTASDMEMGGEGGMTDRLGGKERREEVSGAERETFKT